MASTFPQERWLPKSVLCLRDYNATKFSRDVMAGITVGLVALPLAMAFSIASGLTPQAGIYCAIVTGFLISLLGGSKAQIGGPTGAFDKVSVVTEKIHELPPIVILRLRNMTALDATGLFALEGVARELQASRRSLILCGTREQPAKLIEGSELEAMIGRANLCENVGAALRRAEEIFEQMEAKAAWAAS